MNTNRLDRIRNLLNGIRKPVERGDDFDPGDACGSADKAYDVGCRDGEAYLAEQIRDILNDEDD